MIQTINTDVASLAQPSPTATKQDVNIVNDLLDTLRAHQENCVGMAANMIGQHKRVIVYQLGQLQVAMVNPVIQKHSQPYQTSEGCLSLPGQRKVTRYRQITVQYLNQNFQPQTDTFNGFIAEIIQHEIDHCDGVLI